MTSIRSTELYERDSTGRNVVVGQMKDITLADRVKRLELMGKHVSIAAFRERMQVGVENPLQQLFDQIKGQSSGPRSNAGAADRARTAAPGLAFLAECERILMQHGIAPYPDFGSTLLHADLDVLARAVLLVQLRDAQRAHHALAPDLLLQSDRQRRVQPAR